MSRKLIAILRGVETAEAAAVASTLIEAGISRIEVPMNSPDPLGAIRAMCSVPGGEYGAGTVLTTREVGEVQAAGATFVVSPNADPSVIRATRTLGMGSYPGVFSPTECFAALAAGATALKIFPASMMRVSGLRAIRAVLPPQTEIYAVGGAEPDNFADWIAAGAQGFGLGSFLYKPGRSIKDITSRARDAIAAYDEALK